MAGLEPLVGLALAIAGVAIAIIIGAIALRLSILFHNAIVGSKSQRRVTLPPFSYATVIAFATLISSSAVSLAFTYGVPYTFQLLGVLMPETAALSTLVVLLGFVPLNLLVSSMVISFMLATTFFRALSVSFFQWSMMTAVAVMIIATASGLWVGMEAFRLSR